MVSVIASSVRKGNVIEKDGKLYVVIRAENIHPGKGTPVTHLEMRRISDGVKTQERYKTTESVEKAFIDEGTYNYLYQDGDNYVFMDNSTFEQHSLPAATVADDMRWLLEGATVGLLFWNGQLISMIPPQQVILKVTYTEPAGRGNTATNVTKAATLETGVEVQVPAFIKDGDKVKIDTESGSYMERIQS